VNKSLFLQLYNNAAIYKKLLRRQELIIKEKRVGNREQRIENGCQIILGLKEIREVELRLSINNKATKTSKD